MSKYLGERNRGKLVDERPERNPSNYAAPKFGRPVDPPDKPTQTDGTSWGFGREVNPPPTEQVEERLEDRLLESGACTCTWDANPEEDGPDDVVVQADPNCLAHSLIARLAVSEARVREGCWSWPMVDSHSGYGYLTREGKKVYAHRVAYEAFVGPIPEGLTIDHLCRHRDCVNPAHLEAVPNRENVLRGEGVTAENACKTHCKNGHEYTPENTYRDKHGHRHCETCRAADRKKRWPALLPKEGE